MIQTIEPSDRQDQESADRRTRSMTRRRDMIDAVVHEKQEREEEDEG